MLLLILGIRAGVGSIPRAETLRFALEASRVSECSTILCELAGRIVT